MTDENPQTEFDSPWKGIIKLYFQEFMRFFFPTIHTEIDWTKEPEFLEQEFQQIVRDAELGKRLADKLVKVWLVDGEETWFLIHIELQGQYEKDFAQRMYVYHYRIYDAYKRTVVSLAVLGDENRQWRPSQFNYEKFGCSIDFRFPIVKLLDYQQRQSELSASRNPFAMIVMGHLQAIQTQNNRVERKNQKFALFRQLYEQELEKQDIIEIFNILD